MRHEKIPGELFYDIHEDAIAIDFAEVLSKAIHSLKENCRNMETIPAWACGFLCGFMEEELNERWQARYVFDKVEKLRGVLRYVDSYMVFDYQLKPLDNFHAIYNRMHSKVYSEEKQEMQPLKHSSDNFNELFMMPLEKVYEKGMKNHCPIIRGYFTQEEIEHLLVDCDAMPGIPFQGLPLQNGSLPGSDHGQALNQLSRES